MSTVRGSHRWGSRWCCKTQSLCDRLVYTLVSPGLPPLSLLSYSSALASPLSRGSFLSRSTMRSNFQGCTQGSPLPCTSFALFQQDSPNTLGTETPRFVPACNFSPGNCFHHHTLACRRSTCSILRSCGRSGTTPACRSPTGTSLAPPPVLRRGCLRFQEEYTLCFFALLQWHRPHPHRTWNIGSIVPTMSIDRQLGEQALPSCCCSPRRFHRKYCQPWKL